MIMGVGRFKDWEVYLPVCRGLAEKFGIMIQEILDASRLAGSVEKEAPERVDMGAYMESILYPHRLIARSRGIGIETDFSQDFTVETDAGAMEKAISNIISNAVKYTNPPGRVMIRLECRKLIVDNECPPIPPEALPHLFALKKPFM